MGEPMVFECRTPLTMCARSVSIFMRPPRPKPCWRRHSSRSTASSEIGTAGGQPRERRHQALAVGFAGCFKTQHERKVLW